MEEGVGGVQPGLGQGKDRSLAVALRAVLLGWVEGYRTGRLPALHGCSNSVVWGWCEPSITVSDGQLGIGYRLHWPAQAWETLSAARGQGP